MMPFCFQVCKPVLIIPLEDLGLDMFIGIDRYRAINTLIQVLSKQWLSIHPEPPTASCCEDIAF